jgi:hypothetical protein
VSPGQESAEDALPALLQCSLHHSSLPGFLLPLLSLFLSLCLPVCFPFFSPLRYFLLGKDDTTQSVPHLASASPCSRPTSPWPAGDQISSRLGSIILSLVCFLATLVSLSLRHLIQSLITQESQLIQVQSIPHRNVSPVQSRSAMEFVDKNTIKIISGDLETFELSTEAARLSKVINEQIADGCMTDNLYPDSSTLPDRRFT